MRTFNHHIKGYFLIHQKNTERVSEHHFEILFLLLLLKLDSTQLDLTQNSISTY